MVAGEGPEAVVVVLDGCVEVAVHRLEGRRPDLALVDLLARAQLGARRLGRSVVLRDPSPALRDLLDLVGLADVVQVAGSALEAGGQAEGGEQLGVQEVLPGGDPAP
jgi:hypothetical protein